MVLIEAPLVGGTIGSVLLAEVAEAVVLDEEQVLVEDVVGQHPLARGTMMVKTIYHTKSNC